MNKLFTKIASVALGLSMAIGVGVAIGGKKTSNSVCAANPVTVTSTFSDKDWNVTADSDFGWSATKSGSQKEARGVQVLTGQSGVKVTADTSYDGITSVSIWLSKSNRGVGSVSVKVGDDEILNRSSFSTSATQYTASNLEKSGIVSFTVTCSTNSIYVQKVSITYTESEPEVDDWELTTGALSVTTQPTDKNYYTDDTDSNISKEGAVIKANYWSASDHTVTKQVEVTEDVVWSLDLTNSKIDLSYTDDADDTQTGSISITVNNTTRPKTVSWDLSKASYNSASSEQVVWTSSYASMTWDKNGANKDANAYLGGDNSTSRAYTGQLVTVSANSGYGITKIVFTGQSSYLDGFDGDWTGDSNDYTASLVTTTLTVDLSGDVSSSLTYTVTGTTRLTSLTVYYQSYEAVAMSLTAANNKTTLTSISDTVQLTATAYSDAGKTSPIAGADFSFVSGTTSVATVSSTGLVTAVATGTSTITATTGELSESITITVLYITIDLVNSGTNLETGSSGTFSFTWSSNDLKPSSPTVSWSSSNSTAISVTAGTGAYTAGSAGTNSTITVTASANGVTYTATRQFSVVSTIVVPTHISVTESAGVTAYMGTNVTLHISVLGAGDVPATNQNVTCVSSKLGVFTVTDAGVITPVERGLATVTIVDEGELCTPVVISVRVRNKVIGDAKELGELDLSGYKSSTPSSDVSDDYTAKNSYAAPTDVVLYDYYYNGSTENAVRFGKSGGSGSITFTFASLKVARVDIHAKLWSGDSGLLTVTNGSTTGSFSDSEYNTISYTLSTAVTEVTITAPGKPRFYIDSVKLYGERADVSLETDAQACYIFEETYMHLDDYNSNLGYCKDVSHNYYGKNTDSGAKAHFNSLTPTQKQMFMENAAFSDAWARLQDWAKANGESYNSGTKTFSANRFNPLTNTINGNNSIAIITVISLISVSAVGGYFLLRKRKED